MPWYYRLEAALDAAMPTLVPTRAANLALSVGAILEKRSLCLSELARAYPSPQEERPIAAPERDLLRRAKRLWRLVNGERVGALEVRTALTPSAIRPPRPPPRWPGSAVDRT